MQKKITITKIEDWKLIAEEVLNIMVSNRSLKIIALTGDLGVGKTTFVQALAKQLGIKEVVTSPTFTIMKSYLVTEVDSYENLIHMDAYRIEEVSELIPLHFTDILANPATLFCIEWAERINEALPKKILHLSIFHQKDNSRIIQIDY